MKRKYLQLGSILIAVVILLGSMGSALAAGTETTKKIEPGTTFTYTLYFDALEDAYASAQFNITISNKNNLEIQDTDTEDEGIDGITFTNEVIGGGKASSAMSDGRVTGYQVVYQTGFYSAGSKLENLENQFKQAMPVCTITFVYHGSEETTVTFDNLKVVCFTGEVDGDNVPVVDEKTFSDSEWSRTIKVSVPASDNDDGTSGDTNNGGTNGGGTSNNGTSDNNDGGDDDQGILGEKTIDFNDVQEGDWFYDAVEYAVDAGLFNGTSETTFDPNTPMTRAMFVTILYRLAGSPAVSGTNTFGDVASGEWYTDAVLWASENGVVTGYDSTTFGTNDIMTREQLVTMLYRYAEGRGYDVGQSGNLQAFTDASSISSYALEALQWAYAADIIHGRTATTLVPQGSATRAECAKLMMDFMENFVL